VTAPRRATARRHGRVAPRRWRRPDGGAATVEFVLIAVLIMTPLLYVVLAVFEVQRNAFAVTQAAREAGRAFATADDVSSGEERARYAMALALRDQGLPPDGAELRFGPVGSGCAGAGPVTLDPGADLEVCVTRVYRIPAVPAYLDAGRNTVTARYVAHLDDFRSAG
jgi:Flp pilus assembly protein TadG